MKSVIIAALLALSATVANAQTDIKKCMPHCGCAPNECFGPAFVPAQADLDFWNHATLR